MSKLKAKSYGKQMPKSEARPLGTPAKTAKRVAPTSKEKFAKIRESKEKSTSTQKVVDSASELGVDLHQQSEAIPQPATSELSRSRTMTLTLKTLSKNGKRAIYTGALQSINFALGLFPGKNAPASIEIADGVFAVKAVKEAKPKLTKEERAALPKPTLAERIAKREAQLAKDKAKLAAGDAM